MDETACRFAYAGERHRTDDGSVGDAAAASPVTGWGACLPAH